MCVRVCVSVLLRGVLTCKNVLPTNVCFVVTLLKCKYSLPVYIRIRLGVSSRNSIFVSIPCNMSLRRENASWKVSFDRNKRVLYINIDTNEKTYSKPVDLLTPEEYEERSRQRAEQLAFFRIMENNIRLKTQGEWPLNGSGAARTRVVSFDIADNSGSERSGASRPRLGSGGSTTASPARIVRTISSMDSKFGLLQHFP